MLDLRRFYWLCKTDVVLDTVEPMSSFVPEKALPFPDTRQTFNFDCGATAFQSVMAYYGYNIREDRLIKMLKVGKDGVCPERLKQGFLELGLQVDARNGMTVDDLKSYVNNSIPVILSLQAWADATDFQNPKVWESDDNGHYVVCIGYGGDTLLFEDPSIFGRAYLNAHELYERWHDCNGKKSHRYGMAVFGKRPVYRGESMVRHMD